MIGGVAPDREPAARRLRRRGPPPLRGRRARHPRCPPAGPGGAAVSGPVDDARERPGRTRSSRSGRRGPPAIARRVDVARRLESGAGAGRPALDRRRGGHAVRRRGRLDRALRPGDGPARLPVAAGEQGQGVVGLAGPVRGRARRLRLHDRPGARPVGRRRPTRGSAGASPSRPGTCRAPSCRRAARSTTRARSASSRCSTSATAARSACATSSSRRSSRARRRSPSAPAGSSARPPSCSRRGPARAALERRRRRGDRATTLVAAAAGGPRRTATRAGCGRWPTRSPACARADPAASSCVDRPARRSWPRQADRERACRASGPRPMTEPGLPGLERAVRRRPARRPGPRSPRSGRSTARRPGAIRRRDRA